MSFVLPNVSGQEASRRESQNAFASTSSAPFAGAGAGSSTAMGTSTGSGEAGRRSGATNKSRRKGKGKGRMMMIKIFYSLNSPRFGSNNASTPSTHTAPTPDFLAVLDPALAPSPQAARPSSSSNAPQEPQYSCMARLSAPVWVQVLNGKKGDGQQFGRVTLKTCLSAICISRPELVIDATKDFSVSAVDPYESSNQRAPPPGSGHAAPDGSRTGEGLVEGKGMLSWTLAEKKEGTTMVCGKVLSPEGSGERRSKRRKGDDGRVLGGEYDEDDSESGDETEETLEVWLQLTERDAFTQGQFLDCLRSYHNPVQHLQSEISEFNSSPPKPRDSAPFPTSSSSFDPRASTGDPVKRKRAREQPSLPIPPVAAAAPPAPFVSGPSSAPSAPSSAAAAGDPTLEDPRILALLSQLIPSLAAASAAPAAAAPTLSLDSPQGQALLPAIRTLAQFYGLQLPGSAPGPAQVAAQIPLPPSSAVPSSSAGGLPQQQRSARPPMGGPTAAATGKAGRRKEREHFATIDPNTLPEPPQGKQNPRDPTTGCSNCKRRKSTVWREGLTPDGLSTTSVCNACGIFYNKNGYHRSKANADPQSSNSGPHSAAATSGGPAAAQKGGRPLQGRLTATCEADLKKQKTKRRTSSPTSGSHIAGIIPPLSPSKRIGPGSPALAFSHGVRSGGRAHGGIMSSPGRSPRLRYRSATVLFPATSPVRGSSTTNPGLGVSYESDGEERGPNPLTFGSLFGGPGGSPSPVRLQDRPTSGGKIMPSYLLTASPGTALDRILNETNIGAFGGVLGSGSGVTAASEMQLEQQRNGGGDAQGVAEGGFAGFDFFLHPGSPTLGKENARPKVDEHPTSATDMPNTDLDSFESVLSSLRRDFSTRLSSNALTAPSSPAPSSPCILPRTSAGSPGSKGKAPATSGRAPPSILDSFIDDLVPAFALGDASGAASKATNGRTPESDAWSPHDGQEDATLTLNSAAQGSSRGQGAQRADDGAHDFANLASGSKAHRRAAFIPSHLLAPSDATDFDFGSLPPSSPPQLPSEAFPTPSDYGITPSADGGDVDERGSGEDAGGPLTIEAVAEKVATEPNEDARKAMLALLQSLGGSPGTSKGAGADANALVGPSGDKVQLDRSTVNRLLSLISSNPASAGEHAASIPAPSGMTSSASTATLVPKDEDRRQGEVSALDIFNSFNTGDDSQSHQHHPGDIFGDLFGANPF
ncbi:hypothetical protein JCM10213_008078 [Rhodosporidiobolus nylandii]